MPGHIITLNKEQLKVLQKTLKKVGVYWRIPDCETHDFLYSETFHCITFGIGSLHIDELNTALHDKENDMDAQLKQIQIKPATFDEKGLIKNHEYASITLNVPLDSKAQMEAVKSLFALLGKEWHLLEIEARQKEFNMEKTA